jgi:hypothetical protein
VSYKLGETIEHYCFWGEPYKTWTRGIIIRGWGDGVYPELWYGAYLIEVADYLPLNRQSFLIGDESTLRSVSPLQLLAEV